MNESFHETMQRYSGNVEKYILSEINIRIGIPLFLKEAMLYSIRAGGKRLRPALVFGTYEIFSKNHLDEVVPFAAAIEMIHTYSLIHDDLPAMDDDDFRRGQPSNHKVYGEDTAILAGDALLNTAVEIILDNISASDNGYKLRVARNIMKASGAAGMIGGQILDVKYIVDTDTLKSMHSMKTGAMIKASVLTGGILAHFDVYEEKLLGVFADDLGNAFQIKDDILDVVGGSSKLGKPMGSDEKNKKITYPSVYGVDVSRKMLGNHVKSALESLEQIDGNTEFLKSLVMYVKNRKE